MYELSRSERVPEYEVPARGGGQSPDKVDDRGPGPAFPVELRAATIRPLLGKRGAAASNEESPVGHVYFHFYGRMAQRETSAEVARRCALTAR